MKSVLALLLVFAAFALPMFVSPAYAQTATQTATQTAAQSGAQTPMQTAAIDTTLPPLNVAARQVLLLDAATGTVMYARDADSRMPTSSMSKMMTMYVVFEAIRSGKLHMDDELPVSEHAWKQEGSRMFLNVGQKAKVEDLIRGVIVQSGNDAAVTFAEALGNGSETSFADLMNTKAKELGMTNSHFVNATGLPDPNHYSTARDLATLAMAIQRDFPEYYPYFSELSFTYNGIAQGNRNPLLYRQMNVDGLKTGHTDVGGFGLTASAIRDGRRVVLVLNGMEDMQARADESAKVLDYGYREFGDYPIAKAGDTMGNASVFLGQSRQVPVVISENALVTLPRSARAGMKAIVSFNQPIQAPVKKGQMIGELKITAPGSEAKTIALVAGADVPQVGFFSRVFDKLGVLFGRQKV